MHLQVHKHRDSLQHSYSTIQYCSVNMTRYDVVCKIICAYEVYIGTFVQRLHSMSMDIELALIGPLLFSILYTSVGTTSAHYINATCNV